MGTSRSDDDRLGTAAGSAEGRLAPDGGAPDGRHADPDGDPSDVRLPTSASGEEAAAIAAAIESYLAAERAAAEAAAGGDRAWTGRRWSFAGKLARLNGRAARVPDGAPSDGWSAAGRADRF